MENGFRKKNKKISERSYKKFDGLYEIPIFYYRLYITHECSIRRFIKVYK